MKSKLNLSLDLNVKKELIDIAESKGLKPSQLVSLWVKEYCKDEYIIECLKDEILEKTEEIEELKDRVFDLEEQGGKNRW